MKTKSEPEWVQAWAASRYDVIEGPKPVFVVDQKTQWKVKGRPIFLRCASIIRKDDSSVFISTVEEAVDLTVRDWLYKELCRAEERIKSIWEQISRLDRTPDENRKHDKMMDEIRAQMKRV